jgi:hypothetical protein
MSVNVKNVKKKEKKIPSRVVIITSDYGNEKVVIYGESRVACIIRSVPDSSAMLSRGRNERCLGHGKAEKSCTLCVSEWKRAEGV